MAARFSIGVDLGTTNSALAYVPLTGDAQPEALAIPQWESPAALVEAPTLPSFLYLPEDGRAAELPGRVPGTEGWIAGRLARRRAGETPGRVVRSAKSWLCHHSADRSAPILPWGSEDLAPAQKISPVRAAAFILNYLRRAIRGAFLARTNVDVSVPREGPEIPANAASPIASAMAAQRREQPTHARGRLWRRLGVMGVGTTGDSPWVVCFSSWATATFPGEWQEDIWPGWQLFPTTADQFSETRSRRAQRKVSIFRSYRSFVASAMFEVDLGGSNEDLFVGRLRHRDHPY